MKDEIKIMRLYCLLKNFEIAKKKKDFSYWKFIQIQKGGKAMEKSSLEWQMLNYYKCCRACQKKLEVHAYRKKMKGQSEVVYAHCYNENCELYGIEIPPHTHERR